MKTIRIEGMIVSDNMKDQYNKAKIKTVTPSEIISQLEGDDDIKLIINSMGGSVQSGNEIFTALKQYTGNIESEIIFAASIATVIAMASDKIIMSPTGQFMIHNVTTKADGDYRTMEQSAITLKNMNAMITNAYKLRVKLSDEDLKKMMDAETWLNAKQAKELGFIDDIMFENSQQSYVACFSNDISFEGGEIELENDKLTAELVMKMINDALGEYAKQFNNEEKKDYSNENEEERLTRRIDQLEKLKEDGNALSDAERVELIDDLLQLVRDNRREADDEQNDGTTSEEEIKEKVLENKIKTLGMFL